MAVPVNQLIGQIPAAERRRLLSLARGVELQVADVLWERGETTRHIYFPTAGVVSLIAPLRGGQGLEAGMIGDEGMVGTHVALGSTQARQHAVVQAPGAAWRLSIKDFRFELNASPGLRHHINLYIETVMGQMANSVACVRFHQAGPRLARWLLMNQDRVHASGFDITQAALALNLGLRRTGISEAATLFQRAGLISYVRGRLTVLNRLGLESMACQCYPADLGNYRRLAVRSDAQ